MAMKVLFTFYYLTKFERIFAKNETCLIFKKQQKYYKNSKIIDRFASKTQVRNLTVKQFFHVTQDFSLTRLI